MKTLLTLFVLLFSSSVFAKNIIDPLNFKGTEKEKNAVIAFIEQNMKKLYCENELLESMCTNSILRMMEDEELNSFKQLIQAREQKILRNVMSTYCDNAFLESMCTYSVILMMYEEEVKASGKKLNW